MNRTEERLYLENLLLESARWRMTEDDPYSPIEREIMSRLEQLNHVESGEPEQSVVERGLARAKAKAEKEQERGTRRVTFPDGSMHRASYQDIVQEPYARSPTGYRWVVKPEALSKYAEKYGLKLDDKAAQVDAMWQEHDAT